MSQRALMKGALYRLQQPIADGGLGYTSDQCDVMFDGRPKPGCGEFFVSIHEGEWSARDCEGLDESLGFFVTVTRRTMYAPFDRPSDPLTDATNAMEKLCETIRAKLHMDPGPRSAVDPQHYPVLAYANSLITDPANKFVEPVRFRGATGPSQFKTGEWFGAADGEEAGIARTLAFGGARRIQTIESET